MKNILKFRKGFFSYLFLLICPMQYQGQTQSFLWAKSMGGVAWDEGSGIAVDASGNVYTVGKFFGTVDFDPGPAVHNVTSAGDYEAFVCKLDPSGAYVWAVNLGGAGADAGTSIAVDASGNVYTTGTFLGTADFDPGTSSYNLTSSGPSAVFISKLDKDGNFVWARQLDLNNEIKLAVDGVGNVYTTGGFYGTTDLDPGIGISNLTSAGQDDIFISKMDASGNFAWAQKIGSTGGDHGQSLAVDASGNIYVVGNYEATVDFDPGAGTSNLTSAGGWDIFVCKFSSSGALIWAKSQGGPGYDEGRSISVDGAAGAYIYVAGGFENTCDFDPGAGTSNLTSNGGYDIFVSRLDGSGSLVWVKGMGGAGYDMAFCVASAGSNAVYTLGTYTNTVDFDPGTLVYNLSGTSTFLNGLNGSGAFLSAGPVGATAGGRYVAADALGGIYTTGLFNNSADFDPGAGIYTLTAVAADDVFILKLTGSNVGIAEEACCFDITPAYPNPNEGFFYIDNTNGSEKAVISIYNNQGQPVHQQYLERSLNLVNASETAPGIYHYMVVSEGKLLAKGNLIIEN
jgi:hypothetical protein